MKQMIRFFCMAAVSCWTLAGFSAFEKVPREIREALGTTRGKPVSTGLVFIDGKYIPPPYRVSRVGNQIMVNDRPVTGQLVSWENFLKTQPASKLKVTEVEEPDDAPAQPAPAEKDGDDPAAPKDGGNAPPPAESASAAVTVIEPRLAASDDDLDDFDPKNVPEKMKLTDIPKDSEADKARQKRAEEEKKAEEAEEKEEEDEKVEKSGGGGEQANDSSGGENSDEVDPASPEGEAAAKKASAAEAAAKPPKKTRKVTTLEGKFELNFQAQKLVKPIDAYRAKFEATLRRGGYLFFGTGARGNKPYCHGRTSDAAAAKELLKKLPELMGRAEESEAFCDSVRSAGLFSYINLQIAEDLFRHKADSVFLKQRRREIAEADKLKNMVR